MKLRTLLAKWEHGEIGLAALDNELHNFYCENLGLNRDKLQSVLNDVVTSCIDAPFPFGVKTGKIADAIISKEKTLLEFKKNV
jgi:hypothetical protein